MAQRSIVQITPAGTWRAQFKTTQPGTSGLPNPHLACWALIETEMSGIPTREIACMIVSPQPTIPRASLFLRTNWRVLLATFRDARRFL
jgi:hypothetical protein